MKTKFLLTTLMFVIMIGLGGCATSSPTSVVKAFYKAVDNGNYEEAVGLFSSTTIDNFGIDKLSSIISMQADQYAAYGGIKRLNVTDEKIVGDNAVVYFELEMYDGSIHSDKVNCVKEQGKWKINIGK